MDKMPLNNLSNITFLNMLLPRKYNMNGSLQDI